MQFSKLSGLSALTFALAITSSCNDKNTGSAVRHVDSAAAVTEAQISNIIMTQRMKTRLAGRYDDVSDYSEGFSTVIKDGKYTFVDTAGKELLPPQFETMGSFRNGYASVMRDGKAGLIDRQGKDVFPFHADWQYMGDVEDGLMSVRNNKEKYGFVNLKGETIIPFEYDDVTISWFRHGNAIVTKGKKTGLINRQNGIVAPFEYDYINDFEEGSNLTQVRKGNRWGLMRLDGTLVHPVDMNYSEMGIFSSGLALVKKGDRYGYIDSAGKEVLPATYSNAGYFNNWGAAKIHDGKEGYLIDRSGRPFMKNGYWDVDQAGPDAFIVSKNEGAILGMVRKDGSVLWPLEYKSIMPMGNDEFLVSHPSKGMYYANLKGEKIADYTASGM